MARRNEMGDWQSSGFETLAPTRGFAGLGEARLRGARPGAVGSGGARSNGERMVITGGSTPPALTRGIAGQGAAWPGAAGRGRELGGWQTSRFESGAPARGMAGQGRARRGKVLLRAAGLRSAGQGTGRMVAIEGSTPSTPAQGLAGHGDAWHCWVMPGVARSGLARPGAAWRGPARQGFNERVVAPEFDSRALMHGAARQVTVVRGRVGLGGAGRGLAGERNTPTFESWAPTPGQGRVRRRAVWLGCARRGLAGRGMARNLGDWQPLGFEAPAPTHKAWPGAVRLRLARSGPVRRGQVGRGVTGLAAARLRKEVHGERMAYTEVRVLGAHARSGEARRGHARRGGARSGWVWRGRVRFGRARQGIQGRPAETGMRLPGAHARRGRVWLRPVGRGCAGLGKARNYRHNQQGNGMSMFRPKGDQPQWQAIYAYISTMEIGDEVKDEELFALLPDAPEGSVRSAFFRAVQQVEDDRSRTFDRIRNVGYRMVEAVEHEGLARRQHARAKRRLKAAGRKLHSADRTRLTPEQRRRLDALEDHVSQQQAMIRRLDERVARTETGLKAVRRTQKQDTAELSERLDQVTALLRRHGIAADEAEVPAN